MIVFAPLLIALFGAVVSLITLGSNRLQKVSLATSTLGYLGSGIYLLQTVLQKGPQVAQAGGWPAPFGITYVADSLAAILVLITGFVALGVVLWLFIECFEDSWKKGLAPLFQLLLVGLSAAFLTGDLFHLYVAFEILLFSSFILLYFTQGPISWEVLKNYVLLNLAGSTLFLMATGLLYRATGTLNMAELALLLESPALQTETTALVLYFFVFAFAVKAGLFPLFSWISLSYTIPYGGIAAFFGGMLTKVGVYTLVRVYTLHLDHFPLFWEALFYISLLTMIAGVLAAASSFHVRQILSFHIVSQVGYMTLALSLHSLWGLIACVFYLIHHIVVKANLFLTASLMEKVFGSSQLQNMGDLLKTSKTYSWLFFIPALSLAGLPIFSGFWAKFFVVQAGLHKDSLLAVVVSLLVGLFTLYSMFKIWNEAVCKKNPQPEKIQTVSKWYALPLSLFAAFTLAVGFSAQTIFEVSKTTAQELLQKQKYIELVLGGTPQ